MLKYLREFLALLVLIHAPDSWASVSLTNGNYFISFIDLADEKTNGFEIERIYNSKSGFKGVFGEGWSSFFETFLTSDVDGSMVINEYGGGAAFRFTSASNPANSLEAGVNQILDAREKTPPVLSPESRKLLKEQLTKSAELRLSTYKSLVSQGKIQKPALPEGKTYLSAQSPEETLVKTKEGFIRKYKTGLSQSFNESGKLVQIDTVDKHFIQFVYNALNRLSEIKDHQNKKISFSFNEDGLLEKISASAGAHADYRYSKSGFLKGVKDSKGLEYAFEYHPDAYQNLAKIVYLNDKDQKNNPKEINIRYFGSDDDSNVREVKEIDGGVQSYQYFKDPKKPDDFRVEILTKDAKGKETGREKFEYSYEAEKNGFRKLRKLISTTNGKRTVTRYPHSK